MESVFYYNIQGKNCEVLYQTQNQTQHQMGNAECSHRQESESNCRTCFKRDSTVQKYDKESKKFVSTLICEIQHGDFVLSFDKQRGQIYPDQVIFTHDHKYDTFGKSATQEAFPEEALFYKITLQDGSLLQITNKHYAYARTGESTKFKKVLAESL